MELLLVGHAAAMARYLKGATTDGRRQKAYRELFVHRFHRALLAAKINSPAGLALLSTGSSVSLAVVDSFEHSILRVDLP
jgi:hypothetical protein